MLCLNCLSAGAKLEKTCKHLWILNIVLFPSIVLIACEPVADRPSTASFVGFLLVADPSEWASTDIKKCEWDWHDRS